MGIRKAILAFEGDASDLIQTFDKVGDGVKDMAREIDTASDRAKSAGSGFDTLGEKADTAETRFTGFSDVIGGTGDVMTSFKEGDIAGVAMGLADMAGGIANFVMPMLGQLAGRLGLTTLATNAQTFATGALNTVMALNPIMLVVIAIGALVAAFVVAYKNSETFRDIVDAAFKVVKQTAGDVIGFLLEGFSTFAETLGNVAEAASKIPGFGWLKGVGEDLHTAAVRTGEWADKMHGLGEEVRGLGGIAGFGTTVSRATPGVRAAGGPVTAGMPYVVGEAGPELFVPGTSGRIIPGGGAPTIVVNMYAGVVTPNLATEIAAMLQREIAVSGPLGLS